MERKGEPNLSLGVFYRPDVSHSESLEHLEVLFENLRSESGDIFIGGDFNFPGWDWETQTLKPGTPYPTLHQRFMDLLDDYGLAQIVTKPTRGDNTLDLLITNNPEAVISNDVIGGMSDHEIPVTVLKATPCRKPKSGREIPVYGKADWPGLKEHMIRVGERVNHLHASSSAEVDELWKSFQAGLAEGVRKYIPHRKASSKDRLPWLSRLTKSLMRRRDRLVRKQRKQSTSQRNNSLKELKRKIQINTRREFWGYMDGVFAKPEEPGNQGMKRFWSFIKRKKGGNTSSVAPLRDGDQVISTARGKAEILNRQFVSAFSRRNPISLKDCAKDAANTYEKDVPSMPDIDISTRGVEKLLSNLNPGKAGGPDSLKPRVLKELASTIAPCLTLIFKTSLKQGKVPKDWRQATVAPVYKKGDKSQAANYRPVSLTCICCKVMEHIVVSSIMSHAETHSILYPLQHGFRSGRSCETQLVEFVDDLQRNMDSGRQTDVVIMDFAKAFDKVAHAHLCHKLKRYGIRGETNRWISSFLSGRVQQVVVDGEQSDWVEVLSGVPQGSVLGPCLFLFFINDLPEGIRGKVRLFADDTILYATVQPNQPNHLQHDLDKLAEWEDRWLMQFHPAKCEILSISRNNRPIQHNYTLHGQSLNRVRSAKYLGVTFTSNLTWNKHCATIRAKANRSLGFLRRNLQLHSRSLKERAFKMLVRPNLEYCSTIWDPSSQDLTKSIEMVQRRAARYATSRYRRRSSVGDMLAQLEWPTLEHRRRVARLSLFRKIVHNEVGINIEDHLPMRNRTSRRLNNTYAYSIPTSNTDGYRCSFFPKTAREWNKLPEQLVGSNITPEAFKASVAAYYQHHP